MAPRIIGQISGSDPVIEVTAARLPGVEIEDECPSCGKTWSFDGSENEFDLPVSDGTITLFAQCSGCGFEWSIGLNATAGIKISL